SSHLFEDCGLFWLFSETLVALAGGASCQALQRKLELDHELDISFDTDISYEDPSIVALTLEIYPFDQQLKYPFPSQANPTAHDIFHLSPDASGADIKKRYTAQSQGITVEQAEARFHAITQAYNALLQLDPDYRAKSSDGTSLDKEAEEIKERLAKWSRMGQSSQDRARRQRAMDAEASAGKWWKALMAFKMVVVTVMQVQGRSIPAQKERLKKYIDMPIE
ncbi:7807_t:CDS:2, partial [Acaulospora colombiana]